MNRLQEIEQRLAAIRTEITNRGAAITAEELTALETEVTELQEERSGIQAAAEQRSRILAGIANGEGDEGGEGNNPTVLRSFQGEERDGDKFNSLAYRSAFMNYVTRGTAIPVEYRADEISKTTDVGAVIPTMTLNKIIEKLETVGNIIKLVTRTSYKGGVSIPKSNVKPVATWVAEGKGSEKQKASTGEISFAYHKLRCAVAVSLEVDNMSLTAFETMLVNNVVEAMIKALEAAIIDGDGIGKPKGILREEVEAEKVVSVATAGYADLIKAEGALPEAYENGAVWCMSKKTFMSYYGITDANGQPIGRVNYGIAGKPERFLLGRPVVCYEAMANFGAALEAGKIFGFLFNFKDYALNTNYNMGVKKYEDNETDDIVTKTVMLADGKTVDKESLVFLKKVDSI